MTKEEYYSFDKFTIEEIEQDIEVNLNELKKHCRNLSFIMERYNPPAERACKTMIQKHDELRLKLNKILKYLKAKDELIQSYIT